MYLKYDNMLKIVLLAIVSVSNTLNAHVNTI